MTGRKPKPTALKLASGNPGGRPLNKKELQPVGKAVCPTWLTAEAKAEWRRVAKTIGHACILTAADRAVFTLYCQSWADYKHACDVLKKEGQTFKTPQGYVAKHPMVTIKNEAAKRVLATAAEFGFTPSARSRISVPTSKGGGDGKDKSRFFRAG